jgi:hypothetical protein
MTFYTLFKIPGMWQVYDNELEPKEMYLVCSYAHIGYRPEGFFYSEDEAYAFISENSNEEHNYKEF